MKSKAYKKYYDHLKACGSKGTTQVEAAQAFVGGDLRKAVSALIRKGKNIQKHPESKAGRHWIRYVLVEEPKVFTITDPMTGNKQDVLF